MTKGKEKNILESKSTHRLVHDVLDLAQDKDCVDAYYDILLAADILKARMNRALGSDRTYL